MFRLFAQEVHLDGQLPDLGVEFFALALEILAVRLLPAGTEDPGGTFRHGLFPVGDLDRMDVEFLGDLLDGLDALERYERYAGLEFWFVSSSFCFHYVWFRFGLMPAPGTTIIA